LFIEFSGLLRIQIGSLQCTWGLAQFYLFEALGINDQEEIASGRTRDREARDEHFGAQNIAPAKPRKKRRFWDRFKSTS
jgi:hypothetical protein